MIKAVDCHCHARNSPDSDSNPEEICRMAREFGLLGIAFTDPIYAHLPKTHISSGGTSTQAERARARVIGNKSFYSCSVCFL